MKNKLLIATGISVLLLTQTAYALPMIDSGDNQTFDLNQGPEQLRIITITEDSEINYIKKGTIKITIPEELKLIFDDERTQLEMVTYGTAVDSGKVLEKPAITFENRDKTIVIPVEKDFELGDYVVLKSIYVQGFNAATGLSYNLSMAFNDEEKLYTDLRTIYIKSSALTDSHLPEKPSNFKFENTEKGVKITWIDPTDLDLKTIEIFRGKNMSASGDPFVTIAAGTEEYIDIAVNEGDTMYYIIRASDGRNSSPNTEEFIHVFNVPVIEESVPEEIIVPEEVIVPEEIVVPVEDTPVASVNFTDISGHWAESDIKELAAKNIIKGQDATTFNPEGNLNRAEAAALFYRLLDIDEAAYPLEKPYSDVSTNEWYSGYINSLKTLKLINGNPDGSYKPFATINRAEFVKLAMDIYYYLGNEETKGSDYPYSDYLPGAWYIPSATAATGLGIVEGYKCGENECFKPANNVSRAEAAKIVNIIVNKL